MERFPWNAAKVFYRAERPCPNRYYSLPIDPEVLPVSLRTVFSPKDPVLPPPNLIFSHRLYFLPTEPILFLFDLFSPNPTYSLPAAVNCSTDPILFQSTLFTPHRPYSPHRRPYWKYMSGPVAFRAAAPTKCYSTHACILHDGQSG